MRRIYLTSEHPSDVCSIEKRVDRALILVEQSITRAAPRAVGEHFASAKNDVLHLPFSQRNLCDQCAFKNGIAGYQPDSLRVTKQLRLTYQVLRAGARDRKSTRLNSS